MAGAGTPDIARENVYRNKGPQCRETDAYLVNSLSFHGSGKVPNTRDRVVQQTLDSIIDCRRTWTQAAQDFGQRQVAVARLG